MAAIRQPLDAPLLKRDIRNDADNQSDDQDDNVLLLKQTLLEYLQTCHRLTLAVEPATVDAIPSRDETTNPAGRSFPRRIIPWDTFAAQQQETWNLVGSHKSFFAERDYPYSLADTTNSNSPMTDDVQVRDFDLDAVASAVTTLINMACRDAHLRSTLGFFDRITVRCIRHVLDRSHASFNGKVEQWCSYSFESSGAVYPCLAMDYIAPWKLSLDEIMTGLASEIHLPGDIVDDSADNLQPKSLCAAAVTQLFSLMIERGTSYGYVCTGEAYIFLHIPLDASIVYFSVQSPKLMVGYNDEGALYHTAVAHIFALTLRALREGPACQNWYDRVEGLDSWTKSHQWSLKRNPKGPRPPVVHVGAVGESSHGRMQPRQNSWKRMREREYCTHKCLRGLLLGDEVDRDCPNAEEHGIIHLRLDLFWVLVKNQLFSDRGIDANCIPMGFAGGVASVYKLQLAVKGYTMVAKGVMAECWDSLTNESEIYEKLDDLQGKHIPVCLGFSGILGCSYKFDTRVCDCFLLLSYSGILPRRKDMTEEMMAKACAALTEVHNRGVLHKDIGPFNLLHQGDKVVIMDFEFAEVHEPGVDEQFAVEMDDLRDGMES
ncbi:hypothetical protein L249_5059 [Ophiocordyceps polyrhachis-furcata BCC 54312]|uniref:Protein kinase domain-containing protein n=1 Tax=Ophiocordyceps polyrhachis-furcata BCC 54312 TaxID=1330021 RepID=A0A367L3F7_9HYPO|nr:hypothetical protein L249_5059 [Ophiocordyceps polyrhachis-furcata BCC 54312]